MRCTLLFLSLLLTFGLFAQRPSYQQGTSPNGQNYVRCASYEKLQEAIQNDPSYANYLQQMEQSIQDYVTTHPNGNDSRAVITIPVVVHVVWNTNAQNISDNQIISQIHVLNDDYRRLNADTSNTPTAFQSVAADCQIEFCLATVDPLGGATNGIERVQTSVTSWTTNDNVKYTSQGGADAWDRNSYLNLWVCNLGGGLLGYAQFPGQAAATDGVVIGYNFFGTIAENDGSFVLSSPYNLGRTATHEIGHWLGLYHIWGDDGGACSGSDNVSDTPNSGDAYYGCPSFPQNTCSSDDMFMNYMDYTDDGCMNIFTAGQSARMNSVLNNQRLSIQSSTACSGTGGLVANFVANVTTVVVGGTVDFTDLTSGSPTTWNWSFSGGTPATSTAQNPTGIQYNTVGQYDVTLIASDSSTTDTATKVAYINVVGSTGCANLNDPMAGTPNMYMSSNGGYISGNNGYGDVSKADFFNNYSPYQYVTGAIIGFWAANDGSGGATTTVAIWDNTGTASAPGTVVASSTVNISDIVTDIGNSQQTTITFASSWQITSDFYLGVQLPDETLGDTVAVTTNTDGDTSPGIAWEEWGSGGGWYPYSDANSWGLNLAHDIHPIVCMNPARVAAMDNVQYISVYPNPNDGHFTAMIGLNNKDNMTITVYNLVGQPVMVISEDEFKSGRFELDLSHEPAGMYFIEVNTGGDRYIQKISVIR